MPTATVPAHSRRRSQSEAQPVIAELVDCYIHTLYRGQWSCVKSNEADAEAALNEQRQAIAEAVVVLSEYPQQPLWLRRCSTREFERAMRR